MANSGIQFLNVNSPAAAESSENLEARYRDVIADIESVRESFYARHEEARLNADFVRGEQWDIFERIHLEKQGRPAYVFDQTVSKLNHVLGQQQATRLDATIVAQNAEDEPKAAVLNRLIKWHEQRNDINEVQDKVFRDAFIKGYGVTATRWEMSEIPGGYCKIDKCPMYQFMWDTDTIEIDMSDCRWMVRIIPMRRSDALELLPEYEDFIKVAPGGNNVGGPVYDVMTPRQREQSSPGWWGGGVRDYIGVIEHYERFRETTYVVLDYVQNEREQFTNLSEAKDYAAGLRLGYESSGIQLLTESGQDLVNIARIWQNKMIQSLIIGDNCVSVEKLDLPVFPYQICFGEFDDGDVWAPFSALRDPQKFLNRMIIEYDNQIARSNKQLTFINENSLADGFTLEDFRREKSKTGGLIPVKTLADAVQFAPNAAASPELMNAARLAMEHMLLVVGGNNALGLQENAAESGRAVQARQQAAGTARLPLFNHLRSWRRQWTSLCSWHVQNFMQPQDTLRIVSGSREANYIQLTPEDIESICDIETDVFITDSPDTTSMKESQFLQVSQLMSSGAIRPETGTMLLLKLSNLDEATKNDVRDYDAAVRQVEALVAEQQRKKDLQTQAMESVERSMYRDAARAQIPGQQYGEGEEPQNQPEEQ